MEVVRTHPLLSDIEAKGLETGLGGWEQISGVKTHFVLIDFAVGVYSLKARQYDGMTGLLSPLRQVQTTERGLVAQTAVRLIEEDFGLVGTVQEVGKDINLALKGGKLGEHLDRWVKPGEVFAVCRMTKEGVKLRGTRVPWALLEVLDAPHDGLCRCRLWHRFQEDDLRLCRAFSVIAALKSPAYRGRSSSGSSRTRPSGRSMACKFMCGGPANPSLPS